MGRILIGFLMMMSVSQTFAAAPVSKTVYLSIHDVFVPEEVKANGDAYVAVSGMFPNTCYSWGGAEINHKSDRQHDIRLMANVAQTTCLMVLVPFNKEVILGRLSQGEHTLRFINGDDTSFERTLNIK